MKLRSNKEDKTEKGGVDFPIKALRKRKKKEPPKAWTKRERYLIFYVLLVTLLVSGILALKARSWKLPNLPRIKAPSFNFFQGSVITLEGNKGDSEQRQKAQKIIEDFNLETKSLSGVYSLYVVDLKTGFNFGVLEDEVMTAASLIKLPVMIGLYQESEKGNIDLNETYTLKNEDKVGGSGSLYGKPSGYKITYRKLLELMGQESDNTAFRIVVNRLGEDKVRQIVSEIGMTNTNYDENETTPFDIGSTFEKLWNRELISGENTEELLGFLTDTIYEEWLAAGVPGGIRVAHKYGREVHVVNDAGIVYSDNPFAVVIMSKGVIEREVDEIFPKLAKAVYDGQAGN